jgi:hypothetical protein
MKGWVKIFSGGQLPYVAMIKHLLESNDIAVIQLNKQDSNYLFGELELYVRSEDVIKAKHLIAQRGDE